MDYEKEYKDLYSRLKKVFNTTTSQEVIDMLFDNFREELYESEDERIRKALLRCCDDWEKGQFGCMAKEDVSAIRTYLERPKEPIDPFDTKLFQDGVKEGKRLEREEMKKEPHYTKRNALFDKYVENCDPEIIKKVSDEIDSQLKKEQKPDDNQFPPLDGLDAIKAQYYDRGFKNGFDEGVDSVKPAEWSEEDEKMLDKVCCLINPGTILNASDADYCLELKQWIVSLQERILNSLRPSWKPSEGQPQVAGVGKMEPEVDLEKEIDKGIADYSFTKTIDSGGFKTTVIDYAKIARHFYELGLNARKEE